MSETAKVLEEMFRKAKSNAMENSPARILADEIERLRAENEALRRNANPVGAAPDEGTVQMALEIADMKAGRAGTAEVLAAEVRRLRQRVNSLFSANNALVERERAAKRAGALIGIEWHELNAAEAEANAATAIPALARLLRQHAEAHRDHAEAMRQEFDRKF